VIKYTLTATNNGPSDAQDVMISDNIAAITPFLSATPSAGGVCGTTPPVGGSGLVKCTFAGGTAPGASRSVEIVVKVCPDAPCSQILNTGTASSPTADPDSADTESTATAPVRGAPAPVLGTTGIVVELLLLLLVAAWAFRRAHRSQR